MASRLGENKVFVNMGFADLARNFVGRLPGGDIGIPLDFVYGFSFRRKRSLCVQGLAAL